MSQAYIIYIHSVLSSVTKHVNIMYARINNIDFFTEMLIQLISQYGDLFSLLNLRSIQKWLVIQRRTKWSKFIVMNVLRYRSISAGCVGTHSPVPRGKTEPSVVSVGEPLSANVTIHICKKNKFYTATVIKS